MNPEIKAQWVAALRSGDYKQGSGALHSTENKFCCLGVLCDLAEKAGVIKSRIATTSYVYGDNSAYLPATVMQWADIGSSDPYVGERTLASLNDEGVEFGGIADLIEREL